MNACPRSYRAAPSAWCLITEELVGQGHDVTLFASGDSVQARLVACSESSLRLDERVIDPLAHHFVLLEEVFARADDFDIIHFHIDYLHFPFSRRQNTPGPQI
jgi:hypothetical protein